MAASRVGRRPNTSHRGFPGLGHVVEDASGVIVARVDDGIGQRPVDAVISIVLGQGHVADPRGDIELPWAPLQIVVMELGGC